MRCLILDGLGVECIHDTVLSFKEKLRWPGLVVALCCGIQDTTLKNFQPEFSSTVFSGKF